MSGLSPIINRVLQIITAAPGLTVAQIAERAGVTGDQVSNALIFGTLKALPANLPETIGAHWLQNGVLLAEAGLPC